MGLIGSVLVAEPVITRSSGRVINTGPQPVCVPVVSPRQLTGTTTLKARTNRGRPGAACKYWTHTHTLNDVPSRWCVMKETSHEYRRRQRSHEHGRCTRLGRQRSPRAHAMWLCLTRMVLTRLCLQGSKGVSEETTNGIFNLKRTMSSDPCRSAEAHLHRPKTMAFPQ